MIKRDSKTAQGNIGLAQSIAHFVECGYVVSIPLNDCQKYDLVVDNGDGVKRVQVKTTAYKDGASYRVELKTTSANTKGYTARPFESTSCDILFVLTDGGDKYVIPAEDITVSNALCLGSKYAQYKI